MRHIFQELKNRVKKKHYLSGPNHARHNYIAGAILYAIPCTMHFSHNVCMHVLGTELKTTVITKMCQNESLDGAQPLACQISDGKKYY